MKSGKYCGVSDNYQNIKIVNNLGTIILQKATFSVANIENTSGKAAIDRIDATTFNYQAIRSEDYFLDTYVNDFNLSVLYNSNVQINRVVVKNEFKIEEVVTNYTSNALNHLDGEKEIEIRVLTEENHVKVTVFNTGTPIPEEDIPNLWNKFYKVDKARTREYGGSGIGLSIVKAIMEGLHQQYGVQNYDNGVEFWFTLDRKNQ